MVYYLINSQSGNFINIGSPKPIWHAADQGHEVIVKMLLSLNCDTDCEAPDGTTPLMIAYLNEHQKVIDVLTIKPELKKQLKTFKVINEDNIGLTPLVKMSRSFPIFNDEIEKTVRASPEGNCIKFKDIDNQVLKPFCSLKGYDLWDQDISKYDVNTICKRTCGQ